MLFGVAGMANAQRRNDRDIRDALRSLSSKLDDFEQNARYQMQSSSTNNGQVADLSDNVRTLRDSVMDFQDNFDRRRENRDDVNKIIDAAQRISSFLSSNPQNRRVEDDWTAVQRQIERLASNYGVTPKWSTNTGDDDAGWVKDYPDKGPLSTVSVGLSGTYDLDAAKSENIDDIVADTSLGTEQREDLKDKLVAPAQIALDIRGTQVTLATSNASPVTFTADGSDKRETSASGKTIRVRATLSGDKLIVSSRRRHRLYDHFCEPQQRQIDEGHAAHYDRLPQPNRHRREHLQQDRFVAQLGIRPDQNGGYSDNDQQGNVSNGGAPTINTSRPGNYVVPNGVVITGVLENEINTSVSQNNDRFRLTVQSPIEFRGATIEGYISGVGRSGKVSGQSNVTFNFERIRLRNGQSYDFAGTLQGIKDQNGKTVKIDNEGTAKGDSQTKETAKRGGLGAGAGAILGAILGGAKGAAVGAVIGGGAGAGSVIVTGKDDIRLQQGSTITVQSSSPYNTGQR